MIPVKIDIIDELSPFRGFYRGDDEMEDCNDDLYRDALDEARRKAPEPVRTAARELWVARDAFNESIPYGNEYAMSEYLDAAAIREARVTGALRGLAQGKVDAAAVVIEIAACRKQYGVTMMKGSK